jgi:hypothetical protein
MKNRFTGASRRRKNVGILGRVFSRFLGLSGLTLWLLSSSVSAQTGHEPVVLPESVKLPRSFEQFSPGDVLKRILTGYDPATGRSAGILNTDRKPAFVQLEEAGLWKVEGREHLVVLVGINSDDDPSAGLCGNCIGDSFLAVLKKNGAALSLVAKQLTLPSPGAPVEYESLVQDEVISISGHDSVSLDLAPYKLNGRETLIGFRQEHIWLPTSDWSTRLTLYRIEGERLGEVFSEVVVERVYPAASDHGRRIIDKTVSTISLAPPARTAGGGYNEMVVRKTTVECFDENNDEDCDPKHEDIRPVKTRTEVWRFDGRRYVRAPPARR